ncbi:MAG: ribonuclease D, partial [Acidimicrobiales bacterium]
MAGTHRLIQDQAAFDEVLAELAKADVYGFDTEFHRERTYFPHLALLQVAWLGGVVLIDPYAVDLRSLSGVLAGDGLAVTHAGDQDLEVLERECGCIPARLFDTQLAAGFLGWSSPSLASLVESVLGVALTKGDRLTDWTKRPLTPDQASYAAGDVIHLLDLHRELTRRLVEVGRLQWAEHECEIVRSSPHGPRDPDRAWWRMKDSRSLRGSSRGVAQAVAAWRERRAADIDKPVRFVLSDLSLS